MSSDFGPTIARELVRAGGDDLRRLVDRQGRLGDVGDPARGPGPRASSTSSAVCTRTMLAGASPVVPSTSSWPCVADQHDRVAVGGELARLDVDLGHQRAGGVDRVQIAGWRAFSCTVGGDAVGGEDDQLPLRHLGLLVDEDRAPLRRAARRRACCGRSPCGRRPGARTARGPLDRLHGAVDAGAVAARRGEQHPPRGGQGSGGHEPRVPMATLRTAQRDGPGEPARLPFRDEHRRGSSRPSHRNRCLVPDERDVGQPHAHRRPPDLRGASPALPRLRRPRPRAARPGAAVPPAAGHAAAGGRPPVVGGRRQLQPQVPHPPHRAARAGRRAAVDAPRRPGLLAAPRPLEAALGDVAGAGPGARPLRDPDQDPPRRCRRHLRGRHRDRPLRPRAGARAAALRRRLAAAADAERHPAGHPRRLGRRRGATAAGGAGDRRGAPPGERGPARDRGTRGALERSSARSPTRLRRSR